MKYYFLTVFFVLFCSTGQAYNLRQVSKKDGLSNSAILSMCQDADGLMWFGSCDGLNIYNGVTVQVYNPTNDNNTLSGNIVENIVEDHSGIFWIQTNYGLDRFDKHTKTIDRFDSYTSNYKLRSSALCELFFVKENGVLVYYNRGERKMRELRIENLISSNLLEYSIDKNNILWLFCTNNQTLTFEITKTPSGDLQLTPTEIFYHSSPLLYCFHEGDTAYFVDQTHTLYEYSMVDHQKYYVLNITNRNQISAIIKHRNDYFIAYQTDGLTLLHHTPDMEHNYQQQEIDIQAGIFCLLNDKQQDVVWIGTDGQGVYICSNEQYSIKSTTFDKFTHQITKPVRAMVLDKSQSLWIGTKGDGIVRIPNYDFNKGISPEGIEIFNTSNSGLNNNSVYCITPSPRNILWIGTDEGVNYWSYEQRQIKRFEVNIDAQKLKYVHSVYQPNDSTLWIATVGTGIVKVEINWVGNTPILKKAKRFTIRDGGMSSNYFFTLYPQSDSVIWFGNRGYRAFAMNTTSEVMTPVEFDNIGSNKTLNDVFAIAGDPNGNLWFGTSFGLVKKMPSGQTQLFNERTGLPNNSIHAIVTDKRDNLWLSTNMGIVKFDTQLSTFLTFNQANGLEVIEYSDGAFFEDQTSGVIFFGGINGFTAIKENQYVREEFFPKVSFDRLKIFGQESNIYDYITQKSDEKTLRLNYKENFFSICFSAIDYINANNFTYWYQIEGLSDAWINNGKSNIINFTNIAPALYKLNVKYLNLESGSESSVYSIYIRITPPWYISTVAYIAYSLLIFLIVFFLIKQNVKRTNRKQKEMLDKLSGEHQKEVYESKLSFFTNIAHEFCTPLTLIYGPCDRILTHQHSDPFVLKYAGLIKRNAQRLNDLIQELIEFRRVETGNRQLIIEPTDVSQLVGSVCESFSDLAQSKEVTFNCQIPKGLEWNTDKNMLTTIVTNLLSNAFKYANNSGLVSVAMLCENKMVKIVVSNSGKGIEAHNIEQVFDRYTILDRFENQSQTVNTRNGLGLAISWGMIKLLGGEINVQSEPNKITDFTITLPKIQSPQEIVSIGNIIPLERSDNWTQDRFEIPDYEFDKTKQTILIIDNDPEMLWFICEIFARQYNVIPINNSRAVERILTTIHPNIIICDAMMPHIDGIAIAKQVKTNPKTAHVPLILISAKHQIEEQIEGLQAGAEMYIAKPFNVDYLKIFVKHLITRKETLKEYFSSPISAYELTEGRLTHIEHRKFVQSILQIINANITNKDLSVKLIADNLNMSTRHLYRKINEMDAQSPLEMIRSCRLHIAKDLLQNTKLTIDEIIYKSGFSNRSPFFKAFADKYGCTPKEFREAMMLSGALPQSKR